MVKMASGAELNSIRKRNSLFLIISAAFWSPSLSLTLISGSLSFITQWYGILPKYKIRADENTFKRVTSSYTSNSGFSPQPSTEGPFLVVFRVLLPSSLLLPTPHILFYGWG